MRGIIKRLMEEKHFGFIRSQEGVEYFFHSSDFNGHFNDLVDDVNSGQQVEVEFNVVPSQKGPRAGDVVRTDGGITYPTGSV